MAEGRVVVVSGARTVSGNSGPINLATSAGETLALLSDVTAASGTTPSLTFSVEWSHDYTVFAPADPVDTHGAAITAADKRVKVYAVKGSSYRVVWAISGTTPSFTFAVSEFTTT